MKKRMLALCLALTMVWSIASVAAVEGEVQEQPAPQQETTQEVPQTPEEETASSEEEKEETKEESQENQQEETPAQPEQNQEPEEEPADPGEETPEEPEQPEDPIYSDMPTGWSKEAMEAAVKNGLFTGDGGKLYPTRALTRAEMAAIMTRAFGATQEGDLSGYTDVAKNQWFYGYMAKAVAMGLMEGSAGKLTPNANITRQEAFVVLSRAFGIYQGDETALNSFSDKKQIADWAKPQMAAMVEAGYATGSGGKLSPLAPITREEFAQLMFRLVQQYVKTGEETLVTEGNVVFLQPGGALSNCTIGGDLILAEGSAVQPVTLRNVTVKGKLVIRGGVLPSMSGCRMDEMVIGASAPESVQIPSGNTITKLTLARKATLTGNVQTVDIIKGGEEATLGSGSYTTVNVMMPNSQPLVAEGARVQNLNIDWAANGSAITVEGTVSKAKLYGKESVLKGSGRVYSADIYGKKCQVETEGTTVNHYEDKGISEVVITPLGGTEKLTPTENKFKVSVKFTNVDVTNCIGSDKGQRTCTLRWYCNGKELTDLRDDAFPLKEGAEATAEGTVVFERYTPKNIEIKAVLQYDDETISQTQSIPAENYPDSYYEEQELKEILKIVKTTNIEATVKWNTGLYSNMGLGGKIGSVSKGTKVILKQTKPASARIQLSNGKQGWVSLNSISISTKDYTLPGDYTKKQKEAFVKAKGYSSKTNMLVWISLERQMVNVFTGSKGNWKLVKEYECATGTNFYPTCEGVFDYSWRAARWNFGVYYVKPALVFDGGRAFHSLPIKTGTQHTVYDPTIGKPASHGCVRMHEDEVNWLDKNMKLHTTVVVY